MPEDTNKNLTPEKKELDSSNKPEESGDLSSESVAESQEEKDRLKGNSRSQ